MKISDVLKKALEYVSKSKEDGNDETVRLENELKRAVKDEEETEKLNFMKYWNADEADKAFEERCCAQPCCMCIFAGECGDNSRKVFLRWLYSSIDDFKRGLDA